MFPRFNPLGGNAQLKVACQADDRSCNDVHLYLLLPCKAGGAAQQVKSVGVELCLGAFAVGVIGGQDCKAADFPDMFSPGRILTAQQLRENIREHVGAGGRQKAHGAGDPTVSVAADRIYRFQVVVEITLPTVDAVDLPAQCLVEDFVAQQFFSL
ncbi:hypothetical protein GSUB_00540 [Geoalkalibacter subterraneus]|uniref:Uncharacterized protein n=1 Tax=Geoalkalibacter subterraneus TaxID=483547 RepID=A0A0B5FDJ1_9BACT|nr:hypothetical protein GSUB_00540 [Geoalkalibacter subterraneus]